MKMTGLSVLALCCVPLLGGAAVGVNGATRGWREISEQNKTY